jgi:NodT family efflux transporter outer membrane factor (OMF) lipoprotein
MIVKNVALAICLLSLTGCLVGPDYVRPVTSTSANYKSALRTDLENRSPQQIARANWWVIFADAYLDFLEEECMKSNQDLRAAIARTDQARAYSAIARSYIFPTIGANVNSGRYREARDRPNNAAAGAKPGTYNDFNTSISLNYEIDAWGHIRRSVEAANAALQASQADLESIRLSIAAELAVDYFCLRSIDSQQSVLAETVKALKASLDLTSLRYQNGLAGKLDVQQAQTLLQSEQAQNSALGIGRRQFENAIAVLTGQSASEFSVPLKQLSGVPPPLNPGIPIDLLTRRPDIAEKERTLAARSAQIGVTQAERLPSISLTGAAGFESVNVGTLFNWAANRTFALGSGIAAPLFNAGRLKARVSAAEASYREADADYRQNILAAFGEVETQLSTLHILADQASFQEAATESARQATRIALDRYRNGIESYLNVVTQQTVQLQNELAAVRIVGSRYISTVNLIKVLGGGWAESQVYRQ